MSARDLIHRAEVTGVLIAADNGELVLRGEPAAVNALVPEVRARKAEIIALLGVRAALPTELEGLIDSVARFHNFTAKETTEAKEIAAGDIENALTCFRELAKRAGAPKPCTDDRVLCSDCSNLCRGRCQAAANGTMADTYRGYSPVPDVLRNCEHFKRKGN